MSPLAAALWGSCLSIVFLACVAAVRAGLKDYPKR